MRLITLILRAATAWLETRKLETDVRLYRESACAEKAIQIEIIDAQRRGADRAYIELLSIELHNEANLRRALSERVGLSD